MSGRIDRMHAKPSSNASYTVYPTSLCSKKKCIQCNIWHVPTIINKHSVYPTTSATLASWCLVIGISHIAHRILWYMLRVNWFPWMVILQNSTARLWQSCTTILKLQTFGKLETVYKWQIKRTIGMVDARKMICIDTLHELLFQRANIFWAIPYGWQAPVKYNVWFIHIVINILCRIWIAIF